METICNIFCFVLFMKFFLHSNIYCSIGFFKAKKTILSTYRQTNIGSLEIRILAYRESSSDGSNKIKILSTYRETNVGSLEIVLFIRILAYRESSSDGSNKIKCCSLLFPPMIKLFPVNTYLLIL